MNKLQINELQKKLKIMDKISFIPTGIKILEIYNLLVDNKCEIINLDMKEEMFSNTSNKEQILNDPKLWIAYDTCRNSTWRLVNDELFGNISIYDGYFVDGRPTTLRFTVEIKFPLSFLISIQTPINNCYNDYLHRQWEIAEQK